MVEYCASKKHRYLILYQISMQEVSDQNKIVYLRKQVELNQVGI